METLAERLRLAMQEAGVSQNELARLADMSQPSVWKLTSGKSETSKKIFEIAKALNVSVTWLQTGKGEMRDENQVSLNQNNQVTNLENNKNFTQRFLLARERTGMTQKDLADMVGISQSAINKIEAGLTNKPRDILELAKALNVSVEWLKDGVGELKSIDKSAVPPESEWESVVTWDSKTPLASDEVEVPFLKDIEFACGSGSLNDEDYNGFKLRFSKATLRRLNAPSDGSTIFCFPARGDSMEPVIPDGSTITINTADRQIVDGKVYAINQDGWKRLKLLYRTGPNKVSIRSYNPAYDPEEANLDEVEIIGRAVHFSVML